MNIVEKVETLIRRYVTLNDAISVPNSEQPLIGNYALVLSLWTLATHMWPTFDAFPYLVITAYVKRAGKTRCMETLCELSAFGKTFSCDSPASMFQALGIATDGEQDMTKPVPCMFIDEAERLNQENHPAREFLNKGYKKGQLITRANGKDYLCYCPKCFVEIGDVYDTLRDRSIIVVMRRRTPIESATAMRVRQEVFKTETSEIREEMHNVINDNEQTIKDIYMRGDVLGFLNDRDEEIWHPLFSICEALCPERLTELTQVSVDMCMDKQAPKRDSIGNEWAEAEKKADDDEAKIFLLRDLLGLIEQDEAEYILTNDALDKLKLIPVAQWRKFRGRGLTAIDMSNLLDSMNVRPKAIRTKKEKSAKAAIQRGYLKKDLDAAAYLCGLRS